LPGDGKVSPTRKLQSLGLFEPRGQRVSVQFPRSDAAFHLRAAQYVRMSTDRQEYSTQNQAATIAAYATHRDLQIVRRYADEGRSGLRIEGRDALQQLIQDVQSGQADFSIVLVYDVSRWGRFQDVDESAYYEFVCKRAGIRVLYCAEQFENDGSLLSTMAKYMKRAMAAEWSRDLSVKVFAGQSRLVKLGFRQGGQPGYGLQRVLIGANRSPKGVLRFGERKSIQSDRVILQPGAPHEVETVQRIFRLFTRDSKPRERLRIS
jgi:DNA invertase Pin-like site-specific DNA recombinase